MLRDEFVNVFRERVEFQFSKGVLGAEPMNPNALKEER
jgi:hypothetical protein